MKTHIEGDTLHLTKNGTPIGHCRTHTLPDGTVLLLQFEILPAFWRKGYGTFLLKELLRNTGGYDAKRESHYCIALPDGAGNASAQTISKHCDQHNQQREQSNYTSATSANLDCAPLHGTPAQAFPLAFFEKFGFVADGDAHTLVRHHKPDLTATTFAHTFLVQHLTAPRLCIDATCGNGHDSLFLAQLLPEEGQLLALDLQPEAIAQTAARLESAGVPTTQYTLLCDDHANLTRHAAQGSADAILFNFGWLPGADHTVFSAAQSSLPALEAALTLLKKGGILSAILYSGQGIGSTEKEAILAWMRRLPLTEYTVLICEFANWAQTAPLPCFILKK
ncbi:MAG: GNAT family N-acetyltransferase [Faecalibacterium sp.]